MRLDAAAGGTSSTASGASSVRRLRISTIRPADTRACARWSSRWTSTATAIVTVVIQEMNATRPPIVIDPFSTAMPPTPTPAAIARRGIIGTCDAQFAAIRAVLWVLSVTTALCSSCRRTRAVSPPMPRTATVAESSSSTAFARALCAFASSPVATPNCFGYTRLSTTRNGTAAPATSSSTGSSVPIAVPTSTNVVITCAQSDNP